MVMGRAVGVWAEAEKDKLNAEAQSTQRRKEAMTEKHFMRMAPKTGCAPDGTGESSTGYQRSSSEGCARAQSGARAVILGRMTLHVGERFSAMKKYAVGCIFLLHAGSNLVFCECELTLPSARVSIA